MQEQFRIIEGPQTCSYLPEKIASFDLRVITSMTPEEYSDLLARGYRRFGWQVFRPACGACRECRSMRVLVDEFEPSASERRILRKNESIRALLQPVFVTRQHLDLHRRYHEFMHGHRGWSLQEATPSSYRGSFLSGASWLGRQWLYFERDRLVGVALMDEAPDAISLVYCFYDPDWRSRSPGTYSILNQLLYAKRRGLKYAYLGYCVAACPSLSYKGRFQPTQVLTEYPPDDAQPDWK